MNARTIHSAALVAALLALAGSAPARADTITDCNTNATQALIATGGQGPTVSTIQLAIVHGAVYDAVNSIDGRYWQRHAFERDRRAPPAAPPDVRGRGAEHRQQLPGAGSLSKRAAM